MLDQMIPSTLCTLIGDFLIAWSLGVICFILCSFSVSILTLDHISFPPHPYFLTLGLRWRLREIALSKALKPKEVENLYASDFSMFIREEAELREIKFATDPEIFFFF